MIRETCLGGALWVGDSHPVVSGLFTRKEVVLTAIGGDVNPVTAVRFDRLPGVLSTSALTGGAVHLPSTASSFGPIQAQIHDEGPVVAGASWPPCPCRGTVLA